MLANELRQINRYYAHMDHTDVTRVEGKMTNSMAIQMRRIGELKAVLDRFLVTKKDINSVASFPGQGF